MDIWKAVQTEDGIEGLKQNLLDLDSTFQFKCRKCGKCCKNQDTILFSALDVFRIAKKLEISPDAVIKRYTEVYIGSQSRIPLVHLLMQGKKNACPFLTEEGRCSIHDVKPTVCRLYPLGRVVYPANNQTTGMGRV
ncbi:MAG: YkgJ family cysteine cluster protein [Oscillibacter sp.]|nr:YkgJ family cysteine cluster protein [Oscillibacter sp.]